MVTGLEPLLGPPIAKCAGAGAARLAGWGADELLQNRRRRKIRALTHSKARSAQLEAVDELSAAQLESLKDFCGSVEVEHVATSLARAYLLEGSNKKTDKLMSTLRTEFSASLALFLGEPIDRLVDEAIFDAISEAVLKNVEHLLGRPKLAESVEAELISTAGSLSAASIRNVELLRGIDNLIDIRAFEAEYKSQASAIHATMRLPHAGTTQQVPYRELFVEPGVWTDSTTPGLEEGSKAKTNIEFMMCMSTRVVILGDPGGGKSTLSRKLTYDLAADNLALLCGRIPFFLELRDFASSVRGRERRTLVEYLEGLCKSPYNIEAPPNAIEYLLLNGRAVVVLDGLDELLDVSLRRDVVQAVEGFAHRYPTCPMLVTSRRIGYNEAPLSQDIFRTVTLSEFDTEQVGTYVYKWFKLDASVETARQERLADSFMSDSQFVADLRVNPLMLSLMCGIYASENYIPRNRPDVYEKCALLLFERWDKQRGIVPELSFDAHVQSALRALALHMFNSEHATTVELEGSVSTESSEVAPAEGIPRQNLVSFLTKYLRDKRFDTDEEAESAAIQFIEFCEGRAWVLTDVGAQTYGFTHRTFLEYFAASQLVRLHTSAETLYGELRTKIRSGASDVVAQLSVQILGRTTEDGADDFLKLVVSDIDGVSDENVNLASFAGRALNFVVPRPQVLDDIVRNCADLFLREEYSGERSFDVRDPLPDLLNCSAENAPRIAASLRSWFAEQSGSGHPPEAAVFLMLLPPISYANRLREFWETWAKDNLASYPEEVVDASRQFFWVAIIRYEQGGISFDELISMHGVEALYDFRIAGTRERPPITYRMLKQSSARGFRGLMGRVKPARAAAIADDLLRLLPHVRAPWVTWNRDYNLTSMALSSGVRSPWPGAQVLLALPMLERRSDDEPVSNVPLLLELSQVRAGREKSDRLEEELETIFHDFPEAKAVVDSWLEKNVTLTRGRGRRSRKAAGRSDRS